MNFDRWFAGLPEKEYPHSVEFAHYFVGAFDWLNQPDTSLRYLTKYIPQSVKNVFVIGCGSGKDFLTFDGKYSLLGTDIARRKDIHWIKNFERLNYKCISVEDFTRELKRSEVDMSDTLIVSQGVLMYVPAADQQDFYATCRSKGCKNFIFVEYASYTTKHGDKCLHLGPYIVDFLAKSYRDGTEKPEQPKAHVNLDIPAKVAGDLYEEFIPENVRKSLTPRDHARALLAAMRYKLHFR